MPGGRSGRDTSPRHAQRTLLVSASATKDASHRAVSFVARVLIERALQSFTAQREAVDQGPDVDGRVEHLDLDLDGAASRRAQPLDDPQGGAATAVLRQDGRSGRQGAAI